MSPIRYTHERARRPWTYPQHVLLFALDALSGVGYLQRLKSLSKGLLGRLFQRGGRARDHRYSHLSCRCSHRPLWPTARPATFWHQNRWIDHGRSLRQTRIECSLARYTLFGTRLVESIVDSAIGGTSDVDSASNPPLYNAISKVVKVC